jgi:hypothetical protein
MRTSSKKKKGRKKRRSARGNRLVTNGRTDNDQSIIEQTFRVLGGYTASTSGGTATTTETDLSPSSWGTRGLAMSDLYTYYRITGLDIEFHFHPGFNTTATQAMYMPGNTSWYAAINYAPKSTFSSPTTASQMVDFPHMIWSQDAGDNKMSLNVSRADLMKHSQFKWFKTVSTGSDDPEFTQVCLEVLSVPVAGVTIASVADTILNFRVEFTGSVDPSLIPMIIKDRYYEKWKKDEAEDDLKNKVHDLESEGFLITPSSRVPSPRVAFNKLSVPPILVSSSFTPARNMRVQKDDKKS